MNNEANKSLRKANLVKRIIEYNARSPLGPDYEKLVEEFDKYYVPLSEHLAQNAKIPSPVAPTLTRYFYVLCISLIQECAKKWVKNLVDSNFEIAQRITEKRKMEFDINQVSTLVERRLTIGDFVAYATVPNSLEELSTLFHTATEKDYYESFKSSHANMEQQGSIDLKQEKALELIKECFRKRHIVAHELSVVEFDDPFDMFNVVIAIFIAINALDHEINQR